MSFKSYHQTIWYGLCLAVLASLMHWLEVRLLIFSHSFELYAGIIAILFTLLGIWLALKLSRPKIETKFIERPFVAQEEFVFDNLACQELGLSKREIEVLQLMADGLSNQEIADRLFVSLNTIKTHASRLFDKLEVKRRTQAIERAKKLRLIA